MPVFVMMTRIDSAAVSAPNDLEELEKAAVQRIEAFDASVRDSNAWLRSMTHYLATKDRRIACIAPRDSGIDPVGAARAAAALLHERLAPLEPRR